MGAETGRPRRYDITSGDIRAVLTNWVDSIAEKVGLILRALALLRATLSAKFIEFSNVSKYSFHPILLLCMIFASIHTRSTSGRSPTIFQNPHSLSYLLASSIRFPTPAAGERATEDATIFCELYWISRIQ